MVVSGVVQAVPDPVLQPRHSVKSSFQTAQSEVVGATVKPGSLGAQVTSSEMLL